ncbi:hypothetical protein DL766_004304 [Monosporascus sp. MC13-8B]|nr:hypothetical protein DL766_004304 [Monosporascus sp. MC13-8B]
MADTTSKKRPRAASTPISSPVNTSASSTPVGTPTKKIKPPDPSDTTTPNKEEDRTSNEIPKIASLDRLPHEIVLKIAKECSNGTLESLAQTCKYLKGPATECLYLDNILHEDSRAAYKAAANGEVGTLESLLYTAQTFKIPNYTFHMSTKARDQDHISGTECGEEGEESDIEGESEDDALQSLSIGETDNCLYNQLRFPDNKGASNWTPMHLAALYGHKNVIKFLRDHAVDMEVQDGNGHTPLFYAVHGANFMGKVRSLTYFGADIDRLGPGGDTMLAWACKTAKHILVMRLILAGADVHFRGASDAGKSLLHHFCASPHPQVDFREDRDHFPKEIIQMFLSRGLGLDLRDDAGNTSLHMAAGISQSDQSYKRTTDLINILVSAGADTRSQNKEGVTPLMIGCSYIYNPNEDDDIEDDIEDHVEEDIEDDLEDRVRALLGGKRDVLRMRDARGADCIVRAIEANEEGCDLTCPSMLIAYGASIRAPYNGQSLQKWATKPSDHPYKDYYDKVVEWLGKGGQYNRKAEVLIERLQGIRSKRGRNFFDLVDELEIYDPQAAYDTRNWYHDIYNPPESGEDDPSQSDEDDTSKSNEDDTVEAEDDAVEDDTVESNEDDGVETEALSERD